MMMISNRLIGFLICWFQKNPIYNINWCVLQEKEILLGDCKNENNW